MTGLPMGDQPFDDVAKAQPDDDRFWSVTTIIGALDKPALVYWSAEQTALAAVAVAGSLEARIAEEGEEAVVKFLRDARFRRPKGQRTAAELGTDVHAACEEYAITGVRPVVDDEVAPFMDRFDEWCQRFQPEYQAAEVTVYSDKGYAGTCDGFLTIDGQRLIFDYKTSRKSYDTKGAPTKPYPEQVALQLAAYRYADFAAVWRPRRNEVFRRRYYLLGPEERTQAVPVPEVDGGLVIHITPDHCDAYPIDVGEDVYRSFLFVLESARWLFETSKGVMGKPLIAPIAE